MKAVKFIFKAVLSLMIVLCLALLVLIVSIDPNDFKPQITQLVQEQTGRELSISGDISWSFFPRLGFTLGRTELSNASGFTHRVFAEIDQIDLGIQVKPLFTGQIQADVLYLDGLTAHLEVKANGQNNWDDFSQSNQSPNKNSTQPDLQTDSRQQTQSHQNESNQDTQDIGDLSSFSLGGIHITNGMVSYTDLTGGVAANLEQFEFKTGTVNLGQPIEFSGQFTVLNQFPMINMDIDYQGVLTADIEQQQYQIQNFKFNSNVKGENIPNGEVALTLNSQILVNTQNERAELNQLKLQLDDSVLTGQANITNFTNPSIEFSAHINQLNADLYLIDNETDESAAAESTPETTGTPDNGLDTGADNVKIELPVELLQDLKLRGEVTLDALQIMNLKLQDLSASINNQNGILNLSPLKLRLYDGSLDGKLLINVNKKQPHYLIEANLDKLAIGPFARDLAEFDYINANGALDLNLSTSGEWTQELKRNLNGNIKASLSDAVIQGDMEGAMGALLNIAEQASQENGQSRFDTIEAWLDINQGIATSRDLNMRGSKLHVTGGGQFDIATSVVDAAPALSIAGSPPCPVILKGPLADLDYSKAAKRAIPDCLTARAKAEIEKEKDKLKQKIDEEKAQALQKAQEKIEEEKQRATEKAEEKIKEKASELLKGLFK